MRASEFITENTVDEMALSSYKTMGDFTKQGPFRATDKKLVSHPKMPLKTAKFFEKTPYDFRLFFSNIPGTGRYSETGIMNPDRLKIVFGDQAEQIINGSEDAITVVFVGNQGEAKVMLTPWVMAHRFGHAIQASRLGGGNMVWREAENHFFSTINSTLRNYYRIQRPRSAYSSRDQQVNWELRPEYNALFNAIGTQRSSRTNKIKRPYEFLYEMFAQYLGTGRIKLNPLPVQIPYGRKAWGNATQYLTIGPEYRDPEERQELADVLAADMQHMFDDVLSDCVGKIFVM